MIRWSCPCCGANLGVPDEKAGRTGHCPTCRQLIRIPAALTSSAPVNDVNHEASPGGHGSRLRWYALSGGGVAMLVLVVALLAWPRSRHLDLQIVAADPPATPAPVPTPPVRDREPEAPARRKPPGDQLQVVERLPLPAAVDDWPADPPKAAGLGFNLNQVEAVFSAENGWYWSKKERAPVGTGIRYTAANTRFPTIDICVEGAPENLRKFMSAVIVSRVKREGMSDYEFVAMIVSPVAIATTVIGDTEGKMLRWYLSEGRNFLKSKRDYHATREATWNGRSVTATFISYGGEIVLGITIKP